jgi:peptide/nickel transport system permease protein
MTHFWKSLKQSPIAFSSFVILVIIYVLMLFAEFLAPYEHTRLFRDHVLHPPNLIWSSEKLGFGPQVQRFGLVDPLEWKYSRIRGEQYPLIFFPKVEPYQILGLITVDRKLFGSVGEPVFLFGTDSLGRDIFSRILIGSRISLSVGFIASFISLFIALTLGGLAGYRGGFFDGLIMRLSEFLILIPGLYLLLFLRSLISRDLDPGQSYVLITLVLSFLGWPGTARMIRGLVHSIKNEEFVLDAQLSGMPSFLILWKLIIPQMSSLLIVSFALGIPGFILSETILSYLGLGIADPAVSWGSMISRDLTSLKALQNHLWLFWPGFFLIIVSLAFTFLGEWLRDYLDPWHTLSRRLE